MSNQSASERAPRNLAVEVMERCDEIASFSEETDRLTRTFLSAPMRGVHELMSRWMREAGLVVRLDEAGNLIGRYEGLHPERPVLAIGSHLDTVPNAGKYDGVLGVVLGLAAVKLLGGRRLPFGIDVIGFCEEEGVRFRAPFLGSLAVAGRFEHRLLERTDRDGITMADAFYSFGLDPARLDRAAYPRGGLLGYVEVHIEQGPVLENLGAPAGVVEAIAGQSKLWVEMHGRSGHAGTNPMEGRRDALAAAAELVLEIERIALLNDGLRATVGVLNVASAATNVIPGSARLSIDVRHQRDQSRAWAVEQILDRAKTIAERRSVEFVVTEEEHYAAVAADAMPTQWIAEALVAAGHQPHRLVSGAGHDAVVLAAIAPMAMLFLRSPGGVSHHPDERVYVEDVAVGLDVIVRFLDLLAARIQRADGTFRGLRSVAQDEDQLAIPCKS